MPIHNLGGSEEVGVGLRSRLDEGPAIDEAARVMAALKWVKGNRTRAATLLGVSRATLYRRMKELGIEDS